MNEQNQLLSKVVGAIEDKKGDEILVLDISQISSFADFFVICQGYNQRQNQTICDTIKETLKAEFQVSPGHVEGYETADWILMDYLSFVVHVFAPETRKFYKLERLWSDGKVLKPVLAE